MAGRDGISRTREALVPEILAHPPKITISWQTTRRIPTMPRRAPLKTEASFPMAGGLRECGKLGYRFLPLETHGGAATRLGVSERLDRIRIDRTHFWGSIDPVNPI